MLPLGSVLFPSICVDGLTPTAAPGGNPPKSRTACAATVFRAIAHMSFDHQTNLTAVPLLDYFSNPARSSSLVSTAR